MGRSGTAAILLDLFRLIWAKASWQVKEELEKGLVVGLATQMGLWGWESQVTYITAEPA